MITVASWAQVGINAPVPHPSAILEMRSSSQGLLVPRMTSFERRSLATPANALFLYDKEDAMFFYYDSTYSTGDINWTALTAWRYRNTTFKDIYTHPSVRSIGVGTMSPNTSSRFSVAGNLSIGDSTVVAPAEGLYVKGDVDAGTLTVTDTVRATTLEGKGTIPLGGIIIWTGNIGDIPTGWELCDGGSSNGVTIPDLRSRFIVGYNSGNSSTPSNATNKQVNYGAIGNTGGEVAHTVTINEMPSHDHGEDTGEDGAHNHKYDDEYRNRTDVYRFDDYNDGSTGYTSSSGNTSTNGNHSHDISLQGGGQSHENRPEYYVVAYIIRVL